MQGGSLPISRRPQRRRLGSRSADDSTLGRAQGGCQSRRHTGPPSGIAGPNAGSRIETEDCEDRDGSLGSPSRFIQGVPRPAGFRCAPCEGRHRVARATEESPGSPRRWAAPPVRRRCCRAPRPPAHLPGAGFAREPEGFAISVTRPIAWPVCRRRRDRWRRPLPERPAELDQGDHVRVRPNRRRARYPAAAW
jgi:hypothetical protein